MQLLSYVLLTMAVGSGHWVCVNGRCVWIEDAPRVIAPPAPAPVVAPKPIPAPPVVFPNPPEVRPNAPEKQYHFGVATDHLSNRDKYCVGEREVTRSELLADLVSSSPSLIPADAGNPHLTLFAKDAGERVAITALLKDPDAAPLKERYRIQVYDLSHKVDNAMVGSFGVKDDERFAKSGRAAVVQMASNTGQSKVLGAVFDFPSAKALVAAVPKIDPGFSLKKAPDAASSSSAALPSLLLIGLALAFLWAILR